MKNIFKSIYDAANSAFYASQLVFWKQKILERNQPPRKILKYLPISRSAAPGSEFIAQKMYSPVGMAAIVASSGTDIPKVDVLMDSTAVPVHQLADYFSVSLQELNRAAATGQNISAVKAFHAVDAIEAKKNSIAAVGDEKAGLYGLVTHPNVNKIGAGTSPWQMNTSVSLILADIASLIAKSTEVSGGAEDMTQPGANGVVLFPFAVQSILQRPVSDLRPEYSILQSVRERYPDVIFDFASELDKLAKNPRTGTAGPVRVAVAFQAREEKVSFEVPLELEEIAPQPNRLDIDQCFRAETGGVLTSYPLSITVMDGL